MTLARRRFVAGCSAGGATVWVPLASRYSQDGCAGASVPSCLIPSAACGRGLMERGRLATGGLGKASMCAAACCSPAIATVQAEPGCFGSIIAIDYKCACSAMYFSATRRGEASGEAGSEHVVHLSAADVEATSYKVDI